MKSGKGEEKQALLGDKTNREHSFSSESSEIPDTKEGDEKQESSSGEDGSLDSASYFGLFRYVDHLDCLLLFVGTIGAIGGGLTFPLLFVLFGHISSIFSAYGRYKVCHLDYHTCYYGGYTNVNETIWNSTIKVKLDSFEEQSLVVVYELLVTAVVVFLAGALQAFSWSLQADRHIRKMRIAYFKAILRQDISYHDVTSAGELNSRLTSEIRKIRQGVGEKASLFIQFFSATIASLVFAFLSSWKVSLVTIAASPLMIVSSMLALTISSTYAQKEQAAYAKAGSIAEEAISAIRTVVAFGCQHREVDRYTSQLGDAKSSEKKRGLLTGLTIGFMYLTWMGLYGLAFWYGFTLIVAGEVHIGDVLVAVFEILIGAWSLGTAFAFFEAATEAKAAGSKIFEVIDRIPDIDINSTDGEDPTQLKGNIEFLDVSFSYASRPDIEILKEVSFTIEAGITVALVGESGAGKSTIVQLLQRFYDANEGTIFYGGKDITSLHLRSFRDIVGVVSQEPVLFATTIDENIRWGREGITHEEVVEAAKQANAYDFIMDMPQTFETVVGEGGGQMSGGQKQRIAIARAIARNPKILLLDEATSALDTESESIVQAALDKASAGRTTVVIAHRLSTIRNANKIVVLDHGKVREVGSHNELVKIKDGIYANLVQIQSEMGKKEKLQAGVTDAFPSTEDILDKTPEHVKTSRESKQQEDDKKEEEKELHGVTFTRILKLNKPEWPYIVLACLFSAVAGCGDPVAAILFGETFRTYSLTSPREQLDRASVIGLFFFGLGVLVFIGFVMEAILFTKSGIELTSRLRTNAFKALLRQDISYFDDPRHSTGALCTRLSTDALRVQGCTGIRLGLFIKNVSTLGIALGIGFAYGWKLTLVTVAFIPVMVIGGIVEGELLERGEGKDEKHIEDAGQIAMEAVSNVRTVASLTKEDKIVDMYSNTLFESSWALFRKAFVLGLGYGFSQCVVLLAFAASFRLGTELIQTGEMTFDNVFKVLLAVEFGAMAVGQNSTMAPDYAEAKISAQRLFALFDLVPKIDAYNPYGLSPVHCRGQISFKSVEFSYPNRPLVKVLKAINLKVKPGKTLALVGQSGSGKSTTVSLIERFYDPQAGDVILDGTPLCQLNVSWLRGQMGMVSQEPVLFDQSIRENILLGDCGRKLSDESVEDAAKKANIHDFIMSLPEGYSTNVGAKGGQLSGGQKQRVAIARALVRNPKVLLLDEATSALDAESEQIVQNALDSAREGRTCIIIAHRLSTVKNADQIAVIENGVVVEIGTHYDLLTRKGSYYNLINAQLFRE